jgi:hypothetical protein
LSCVSRLRGIRHRRARKLAIGWEHAAAMAYWHRREEFRGAEEQGFALLTRLPTHRWSRRHWREFTDTLAHASALLDRNLRTSGAHDALLRAARTDTAGRVDDHTALRAAAHAFAERDSPPPTRTQPHRPNRRGPLADQCELRWRISTDALTLRFGTVLGGGPTRREASRRYLPWLTETLEALNHPMATTELQSVATQWRERRGEFFPDSDWADVIIIEPLARRPTTWWWRLWRGDEPRPPIPTAR